MSFAGKVLVIGDDTRSFLTIVRSLGRAGQVVHVAPFNFRSPALRSRYIGAVHWLPYHLGNGHGWQSALAALWDAERYDLAIPCDERSLLPLHAHRDWVRERGWTVAMPDQHAVEIFYDKHATREMAREVDVPVAPGRVITEADTALDLIDAVGLPVVLKPRCSYRLNSLHARGKVVVAGDRTRVACELSRVDRSATLVERYVVGRGVGVSVLVDRGTILQAFEHHRVHDDLAVGGSYYRRSAALSPDLLEAVRRLMTRLAYTGVAMVEFRRDERDGSYSLLEVNARPWGSMPLPVGLGVNFPERWRRLVVAGEPTPAIDYTVGIYGRNLVPDLEFLILEVRRLRHRPLAAARMAGNWVRGLARIASGRELSDTLVRDDLRPGAVELWSFAINTAGAVARRIPPAGSVLRRQTRRRALRLLRSRIHAVRQVLFVCAGNICRSPFAEHLLRARLIGPGHSLRIGSAGMLPIENRRSPPAALRAAEAFGIDLAPHRSQHLNEGLAGTTDLVVAFDDINVSAVLDRYPHLAARVLPLGALLGDCAPITDPYGRDLEVFYDTFRRIDLAVDRIVDMCRSATGAPGTGS